MSNRSDPVLFVMKNLDNYPGGRRMMSAHRDLEEAIVAANDFIRAGHKNIWIREEGQPADTWPRPGPFEL